MLMQREPELCLRLLELRKRLTNLVTKRKEEFEVHEEVEESLSLEDKEKEIDRKST